MTLKTDHCTNPCHTPGEINGMFEERIAIVDIRESEREREREQVYDCVFMMERNIRLDPLCR